MIGKAAVAVNEALVVVLYTAPVELLANVSVLLVFEHTKFAQVQPAEPVNVKLPPAPKVKLEEIRNGDNKVTVLVEFDVKLPHNIGLVLNLGVADAFNVIVDPDAIIVPPVELFTIST
jgi:hypothetical protein